MKRQQKTVVAIFLAAGVSTRMGKPNKLLLPYKEVTLIEHTFSQIRQSQISDILLVIGHQANAIKNAVKSNRLSIIYNPNYSTGMTSTIQTGIKAIKEDVDGFMIALSDMPYLTKNDYNTILDAFKTHYDKRPLIIVPKVRNRIGNPVIFSKAFKQEILKHQKPEGCKTIIKKNNKFVITVSLNNPNAFNDIDRPEDYQKLIDV